MKVVAQNIVKSIQEEAILSNFNPICVTLETQLIFDISSMVCYFPLELDCNKSADVQ